MFRSFPLALMALTRRAGLALTRAGLALAAWATVAGCAARPPAKPEEAPPSVESVRSKSDGVVDRSEAGDVYRDASAGFDAAVPPGWKADPRFMADASGPPPSGDLRVRFSAGGSSCVIDIAAELVPSDTEAELREKAARSRELFFFSRIDEPAPHLSEIRGVWTATLVPPDPSRMDIAYWVALRTPGRYLRVEGRFPVRGVAPCKDRLDDVVRSLRDHGARGPSAARQDAGAPANP